MSVISIILSSIGVSVEEPSSPAEVELTTKLGRIFLEGVEIASDLDTLKGCLTETEKGEEPQMLLLGIDGSEELWTENKD